MASEKIIQQGAEAILIRKGNLVLKRRTAKGYRFPLLDTQLRKRRTKSEGRLLVQAAKVISVPDLVNVRTDELDLVFLDGKKLSDHLDSMRSWSRVCTLIGENVAKLHDAGIIHGDLTTSNMIAAGEGKSLLVYFIDFGLGYFSQKVEDKAVDLHLLRQALEAKHFAKWKLFWSAILETYRTTSSQGKETLIRLEKVEKRGRYKAQY